MTHLKRLNFGPHIRSGGGGLNFEDYVRNALNQIERWSHEVNKVLEETATTASGDSTADELLLETGDFLLRQGGANQTMGLE
jgi:hypothetical protein